MKEIRELKVLHNGKPVGTLAETKNKEIAFEYDGQWIEEGFSISPFSLPLEKKLFIPKDDKFEGLFGVFSDSLPDGWGRLLVDRMLLQKHINPRNITPLQRLAIVGSSGMGALQYQPEYVLLEGHEKAELDTIAAECKKVLQSEYTENLDELFALGGSSGGARPKILTEYEGEDWIIKFPSSYDEEDIGYQEFLYGQCAKKCGIEVEEIKLFKSNHCKGYFGTRRFDVIHETKQRIHMITVSGLLETSHRIPNLDYNDLMKLTWILTKEMSQVEQMYRRMCFNVFSHNRDDHSKNFSFMYDEGLDDWRLTPAYDMTYSNSIGGEHATCVDGNGKNPGINELLSVAKKAGVDEAFAYKTAIEIKDIVKEFLINKY